MLTLLHLAALLPLMLVLPPFMGSMPPLLGAVVPLMDAVLMCLGGSLQEEIFSSYKPTTHQVKSTLLCSCCVEDGLQCLRPMSGDARLLITS